VLLDVGFEGRARGSVRSVEYRKYFFVVGAAIRDRMAGTRPIAVWGTLC